jgi:dipeptidyl aminopeptidase/acylaminoacyl peptidase
VKHGGRSTQERPMTHRLQAQASFRRSLLPALCAAVLVAACSAAPATPPAPSTAADVPLVPRRLLFGNPERANPTLSDDGRWLAFRAAVNGVMNVWIAPADEPAEARAITNDTSRGIRQYLWAYTNTHILYLQDKGGDENWRVYAVDVTSGATRDLTPFDKVAARIQEVSRKTPQEILVALNNRNPQLHDVHRVNIVTGQRTLLQRNDGYAGFQTDDDYKVRFAFKFLPDGGMDLLRHGVGGRFEPFQRVGADDVITTYPLGFDKSNQKLYLLDSRNRDTSAVFSHDLTTGAATLLAEDPRSDAQGVLQHPEERTIQAVTFNYDLVRWQVLDQAIAEDMKYLQSVTDGEVRIESRTRDDSRWIVAYNKDNGPIRYYLYDRARRNAGFLFSSRPALDNLTLSRMHPRPIKARDGLTLVSYLSLPVWTDPDGDGRPAAPVPTVLLVHGGPWGRDSWGYHSQHQLLTNRGYAVLSVNFRASTGFGKKFVNAGNLEWGAKMHDDLIDAVNWAVAERIADPAKTAIMGGSYGGYATLAGLTFTPDVFAAGVDIVGPSNLVTLLNTIPPYWAPQIAIFTSRVGDHRTDEGRKFLTSRSPLTHVDHIARPLLIGQGANDPRVKQSESDQIVKAMQAKNIPVTYALFPDEGHGFARPENSTAFMALTEAFLARHLGGRAEPIGDAFAGSSLTVPNGADLVPGIAEVLTSGASGRGAAPPATPTPK